MAFASEAGTWRNIYLTGAQELRNGPVKLPPGGFNPDMLAAITTPMMLDFAAVRLNPDKASATPLKLTIDLTDRGERHLISIANGVLVHEAVDDPNISTTVHLTWRTLLATLLEAKQAEGIVCEGDASLYPALCGMIDPIVANFAIVTP